jgi:proteasome lid subunit RPN8/RPN11
VSIGGAVLDAIAEHARETGDEECCGLLLGAAGSVLDSVRTANAARDRTRQYTIDAAEHFAAIRWARQRQLDVIGSYHSHPKSAPVPSATDLAEAFENFLFVIAGLGPEGSWAIRAWQLVGGNFIEVPLVRCP